MASALTRGKPCASGSTLLLSVAVLGVGTAAPTASADSYRVAQDEAKTTDDDDDGTDYGWIGLLGLAGLAGLLGRKRNDVDYRDRDRDRVSGTTTTRDR